MDDGLQAHLWRFFLQPRPEVLPYGAACLSATSACGVHRCRVAWVCSVLWCVFFLFRLFTTYAYLRPPSIVGFPLFWFVCDGGVMIEGRARVI